MLYWLYSMYFLIHVGEQQRHQFFKFHKPKIVTVSQISAAITFLEVIFLNCENEIVHNNKGIKMPSISF